MDPEQEQHGFDDVITLANYLSDYQIILWAAEGRQTVASEVKHLNPNGSKFIGLFYQNGHYEFVSHTVGGNAARFCFKCGKFDRRDHWKRCAKKCKRCGTIDCEPGSMNIQCPDCNILFRSQKCFDAHLLPSSTTSIPYCKKYFYCLKCSMFDRTDMYSGRAHNCGGVIFCSTCHVEKGPKHQSNLICVKAFCSECYGAAGCKYCEMEEKCTDDHPEERMRWEKKDADDEESLDFNKIFDVEERNTPLTRFAKFLLYDPKANGAYVIAHNGGR